MPYLTQLDDIVKRAGLDLDAEPGWQSRGHGVMDADIRTIVVHHTAGPRGGEDYPSLRTVRDGRPDLKGPLAHFGLGRGGVVHLIAAGICWHTGAVRHIDWSNRYSIGIEVENSGMPGDVYPKAQTDALVDLCAELVEAFNLDAEDVRGHKEICEPVGRKVDPSFDMAWLRGRVRTRIADKRAGRSSTRTLKAPKFPLPEGYYFGPKSGPAQSVSGYYSHGDDLRLWQAQMLKRGWKRIRVTGLYDDATASVAQSFRREKGMGDSAAIGPKLWAAAWEAPVT